jgi:mRNA (guanine-N7-)-methyltransferase
MLVHADMGDVNETLNTSAFDTYIPATKQWTKTIPCPLASDNSVQSGKKFTIASCQFAMHYMFEDIDRANHFFQQVSTNLELGGALIATTVDARVVADLAVKVDSESDSNNRHYKKDLTIRADSVEEANENVPENEKEDSTTTSPPSSQCPLMMNIHFDDNNWRRLLNIDQTKDPDPFGIRYVFTLVDDKDNAVDAPEWLVPMGEPLRALAAAHGLEVDLCQNFHDFVYDKMNTDASLR